MFTLLILSPSSFAQESIINGLVSDIKTGETIPTVNNELMLGAGQKGNQIERGFR